MYIQSKLLLLINIIELPHAETFMRWAPFSTEFTLTHKTPFFTELQSSLCLYKTNNTPSYCLFGL